MSHLMNNYGRLPVSFDHGQGVWLWDKEGHKYLDALAGIAVNSVGHAHPRLVRAIADQASKLIHCSNYFNIDLQEKVAEKLVEHSGLEAVFFCNSGLEANECAIKIARKFGHAKGIEVPNIIVLKHAFHGRSIATLSATGNPSVREDFSPYTEGFIFVDESDFDGIRKIVEENKNVVAIFFVRYEGTEAKVGAEMNVIKDVVFEGRILQVTEKALEFVRGQIKERTYLGADTRFVTEPEYPEFAWKELIVNAVAHRDYSIKGTDIQIKMFDDRLTVESPGTLPGIVRLNNMRHVHFSRNPKIAQFLHEYEYVQEFGEGVDRLYEVMETARLPQPEYRVEAFMLYATIRNTKLADNLGGPPQVTPQDTPQDKIIAYCMEPRSKAEIAKFCGFKDIKHFTAHYLKPLLESGQLRMTIPDKPNSRNQKYITVKTED